MCSTATGCSKRLRCSEVEFAADHANLHQETTWYANLTTEQAATFVNIKTDDEEHRLKVIESLASGGHSSSFTLPAVSQQTRTLAGYVHASFADQTLTIKQCKVDRPHQGRGLGGLLIEAAEKRAEHLGAAVSKVQLTVLRPTKRPESAMPSRASRFAANLLPCFHRATVLRTVAIVLIRSSG